MAVKQQEQLAFLFPGQASQFPGMGKELYNCSPAARDVFAEVDDSLNGHFTDLMFEGDPEVLTRTENAQIAIAAVTIAAWRAMEEITDTIQVPEFAAGHSVGEYSALAVTGAVSIADAITLVAERGRLMGQACRQSPGGMAALIGIERAVVEDICRLTGVFISNINSSTQIVISGNLNNLAQAIDLASYRGAKRAVRLKVGGAFHSDLMRPAQEALNHTINNVSFYDPITPIISNVSAEPLHTDVQVKDELKVQLQSCVLWDDSIKLMMDKGATTFVEVGPGAVLTGMLKRSAHGCAKILAVGDYDSVERYAKFCDASYR